MRKLRTILFGCLLVAAPALAQSDFVAPEPLRAAGLAKFWQLQLPLQAGERVVNVYRVDDVLYATTNIGDAFSVHAHTGALRWLQQVTTGGYVLTAPAHVKGRTIFVLPARVLQYDQLTGDPVRQFELRFSAASPPATNGSNFWIGGQDHRLYCFDPDIDFEIWKAATSSAVVSRPAITEKRVVAAGQNGIIYTCTPTFKRLINAVRLDDGVTADLVPGPQGVFAAGQDQSLYLISAKYGKRVWRARLSSALREPPLLVGEVAYQFSDDDGLVAIDARVEAVAERILWKLPDGRAALGADGKTVFALSRGGELLAVDAHTGAVQTSVPVGDLTIPVPTGNDPAVYLASAGGQMFCARSLTAEPIKAEALTDAIYGVQPQKAAATTQPAAKTPAVAPTPEPTTSTLPPIGGTSKVSKGQAGGGAPAPASQPKGE